MAIADLSLSHAPAHEAEADVLVLAAVKAPDGPAVEAPDGYEWVEDDLIAVGASGAAEELTRLPARNGGPRIVAVVGLGSGIDAASLRRGAGTAARRLAGTASAAFALPHDSAEEAAAILEGAALGAYAFSEFRSAPGKVPLAGITLLTAFDAEAVDVDRVRAVAEAVTLVKDLVNTPPAELSPAAFAERALAETSGLGIEATVWDEAALAEDGFGGILGVGSGSSRPPRLVKVDYAPADGGFHLAIVGKGITFDSGGLSLKPMISMAGMKSDMAGAAAALAAVVAVARLGLPIRVTAWLCMAENLPSGTAVRPNDVLRIHGGKTVEVLNTDAEGRLVLADGLVAASEERPDAIVDIATLTGAQIVALGNRTGGVMGDPAFGRVVLDAADAAGEPFWPMPMPEEIRPLLDSDVADLANAKLGNTAGGMLLAAIFLREFVGDTAQGEPIPWAHLDIAGPSFNSGSAWGFTGSGGTGAGVRTLIRLSQQLSGR
ncbi:leucyl aminopeptidase [Agromyces archimandritae]|uniref:Probable cytosol aminopeptidase n=1 Tax=Agromyces archimandritae TaxID=2781962 RepID=A0A975FMW8_9MICO|nr:leucyl aminopeptidase [Agromyces archimandritae]QTX04812.1 leucyl aminopeptidase [Agromyces archimandritae]